MGKLWKYLAIGAGIVSLVGGGIIGCDMYLERRAEKNLMKERGQFERNFIIAGNNLDRIEWFVRAKDMKTAREEEIKIYDWINHYEAYHPEFFIEGQKEYLVRKLRENKVETKGDKKSYGVPFKIKSVQ